MFYEKSKGNTMEDDSSATVGMSNDESNNKNTERFILVKGSTEGIKILPKAEGVLYRVSKRAAKDILEGLKENGFDAVMLKESKKGNATAA